MVAYDLHSKWPEVAPSGSVTSQVIIDFLDSQFSRWGLPRTITTDNGPQMVSAEFTDYLRSKGIHHVRTAYYNPQANGGVERFNQSLKNGLRAHMAQGCSFSHALRHTLLHYRATKHSTTGVSPASLMLGRELTLPLDRLRSPTSLSPPLSPSPVVRASVTQKQAQMKRRFDLSKRAKVPVIAASDWVRVRRPHRDNKMASFWSSPFQVARQLGPATFLLSDGSRWHSSRLRKVPAPPHTAVDTPLTVHYPVPLAAPAQVMDIPPPALFPPSASPRPTRVRSRPGHLQDFVSVMYA